MPAPFTSHLRFESKRWSSAPITMAFTAHGIEVKTGMGTKEARFTRGTPGWHGYEIDGKSLQSLFLQEGIRCEKTIQPMVDRVWSWWIASTREDASEVADALLHEIETWSNAKGKGKAPDGPFWSTPPSP